MERGLLGVRGVGTARGVDDNGNGGVFSGRDAMKGGEKAEP